MKSFKERRILPYSANELFALVADVASYKEFLPWCADSVVMSRETAGEREILIADLVISFKVHRERVRSRVTLDSKAGTIVTESIAGAFKHQMNSWHFEPRAEGGTLVTFGIEFEFKSRTLEFLIGLLFEEASKRLVAAFEHRARALYGRRTLANA